MRRPWRAHCGAILLAIVASTAGPFAEEGRVVKVVDGDTLVVGIDGRKQRVRLIGVDTPETVHPDQEPEPFGAAATAFTKGKVLGRAVRLERDPNIDDRDKYDRLLRYVYLEDGTLLNAEIIRHGYGRAYTWFPYSRKQEFVALEREARSARLGMWVDYEPPPEARPQNETAPGDHIVFVTRSGAKYHRRGCRHLSASSREMRLIDAQRTQEPCAVCSPPVLAAGDE